MEQELAQLRAELPADCWVTCSMVMAERLMVADVGMDPATDLAMDLAMDLAVEAVTILAVELVTVRAVIRSRFLSMTIGDA